MSSECFMEDRQCRLLKTEPKGSTCQLKLHASPSVAGCDLCHLELASTRVLEPALVDALEETACPLSKIRPKCCIYGGKAVVDEQLRSFLRQTNPAPVNSLPNRRHAELQLIEGCAWRQRVCRRKACTHSKHECSKVFRRKCPRKLRRKSLKEISPLSRTPLLDQILGRLRSQG